MNKIMILGSAGMAGNIISRYLNLTNNYEIIDIARNDRFCPVNYKIDIEKNLSLLEKIINQEAPYAIINCIGLLIKDSNTRPDKAIYINSYFPHWLEEISKEMRIKIIHLSTDCVFSGKKGSYFENDIKDGEDWYARSKALGEIVNDKDLTIRTSIIGTELKSNGNGLLEWFIKQKGTIWGFSNHYWSGVTTLCLAQNIDKMINCNVVGLYQLVPPYKINKYNLLKLIQKIWNKNDVIIEEDTTNKCDKSLFSSYRNNFQSIIPINYEQMLIEMKNFIQENEK